MANIAERVPNILCKTFSDFIGTFQAALSACNSAESLAALTEAACYVAIATQVAISGQPDAVSFLSSTRMDNLTVDPNSLAAKLGSACLVTLFTKMEQASQDVVQSCLEHFAHAASTCPSLLAGDAQVFGALVRTCLNIASASTDLALAACQVLASLCTVGNIKRRILPNHPAIQDLIKNEVLRICAELCVNGVDDDVEEWASEPANIMVRIMSVYSYLYCIVAASKILTRLLPPKG